MAWAKQVTVLVVWCFMLVGDTSRRAPSSTSVPHRCSDPLPVVMISLLGSADLGTKGSAAEVTLRGAGGGAWAVHSCPSLLKKPVGNSFLCQNTASKASVRECRDGI